MTENKHDLERFVEIENELRKLRAECAVLNLQIYPLEKELECIVGRWGKSGRIFKVGDIILQANRPHEYAALSHSTVEDVSDSTSRQP